MKNTNFIVVCAFPYIFAFTTDSMEIRLIINGNLVQTMVLPKLALICSKVRRLKFLCKECLELYVHWSYSTITVILVIAHSLGYISENISEIGPAHFFRLSC
jgi:hypothetical protein